MSNNNSVIPQYESLTEAAFVALQMSRALNAAGAREQSSDNIQRPVFIGELVHYIRGSENVDELRITEQLGRDLALRRLFDQLLEGTRVAVAPAQAQAASDETMEQRSTRTFTLTFKRSRANSGQVYILLTVLPEAKLEDGYCPVILASQSTNTKRLCFPSLKDHNTQVLRSADHEAVKLVQNPEAELSLI